MANNSPKANKSKVLTIAAIAIGAMLLLTGLGIVVVKVINGSDEPVDCCAYPIYDFRSHQDNVIREQKLN